MAWIGPARASPGGAPRCRRRSSRTRTSRPPSTRPTRGSWSAPASASGGSATARPPWPSRPPAPRWSAPARRPARSTSCSCAPARPTSRCRPPSSAVQHALDIQGGAMDLNAACSGFVYGLVAADGLLRAGMRRILLVGAETMSRMLDWDDRSTAILFGDGAGAVVLERGEGPGRLLGLGSRLGRLAAPHPLHRSRWPRSRWTGPRSSDGRCGSWSSPPSGPWPTPAWTADDIALFVPHQANARIITSACAKLGIGADRTANVLDRIGNTSAASIPIALAEAADAGRLQAGRPRAARGLRRRHELGLRRARVGGMSDTTVRTVLVTGGSRGIGLACARAFAAAGHRVAVTVVGHARRRARPHHRRLRRHRRRAGRRRRREHRGPARPRRGPGRLRRHHPGQPAGAHVRGRLRGGRRHEPHRHLARWPSASSRR